MYNMNGDVKMKKCLAIILSLIMIITCFPLVVTAAKKEKPAKRYTVLVLDTSDTTTFRGSSGEEIYTADTAIEYVKKASSCFIDSVGKASGDNYVAIVSYKDVATTISGFSKDFSGLKESVYSLYESSTSRSIADGLKAANSLLQNINDENAIKNVVLFTTGITNDGDYNYSGRYNEDTVGSSWRRTDTDVKLYAYANTACEEADSLKSAGVSVYTIGLFQTMEDMPEEGEDVVALFKLTAKDLATSEEHHHSVDDPEKLEFTFGEVAEDIVDPLKTITFTYQSGKDYTATCYYSDEYFYGSSYDYNPSLATMSLSFAMSAFGSSKGGEKDYSDKSRNAKKLLEEIGVEPENIEVNDWFTKKPTTDSIGAIIGSKSLTVNGEQYTLIALAVRGSGYESEWASNFTIGTTGEHNGFEEAKNNVVSFLKKYVAEKNVTGPVKIWITGYSRAAATANLVGGAIDNGAVISDNISYDYNDVYTYCFEPPAGALTSEVKNKVKYNNIFNIINSSDPVPYVAPAALGFCRYGVDYFLPSQESSPKTYKEQRDKMLEFYYELDSTSDYVVDDFQMKNIELKNYFPGGKEISLIQDDKKHDYSQGMFLSNYVSIISNEFLINRETYVNNYQNEIREVCSVMFGSNKEQSDVLIESVVAQAKSGWPELIWASLWNDSFEFIFGEYNIYTVISDWLETGLEDAGITDYDKETIDSAAKNLADLIVGLAVIHPNYMTTAVMNIECLGAAHYPELCYSWLASMDDNYDKEAKVEFNNGGYRIIRINCDVDIEVFNKDGIVIASIEDEAPSDLKDSSYLYGVDADGQKYVVLPIDSDYDISITGREDGTVNYSINEYCSSSGGYTRSINYFDIELGKDEKLSGKIPAYSEDEITDDTPDGSKAKYALFDSENNEIECDSDESGANVSQRIFDVNALSSNEEYGVVTGSGIRQFGTFAQVEAIPIEGNLFVGWYKNDELVSTESVYRVCVKENIDLVAKFEENTCPHENCSEWVVIKEATKTEKGFRERTCLDCGYKMTEEIPEKTIVGQIILIVVICAVALILVVGIAVIIIVVVSKKRKKIN